MTNERKAGLAAGAAHEPEGEAPAERWELLRDVLVFQGKLVLDGLRDLLLSPLSIGAAIIGLIAGGDRPGRYFYGLLSVGRQSDVWINLFGTSRHRFPYNNPADSADTPHGESVDVLVDKLETLVKRQYERGGITANAKDAIDRALDNIERQPNRDR